MTAAEELHDETIVAIARNWEPFREFMRSRSMDEIVSMGRTFFAYGYARAISEVARLSNDEYLELDEAVNEWLDGREDEDG